jgi:hypothetical protein
MARWLGSLVAIVMMVVSAASAAGAPKTAPAGNQRATWVWNNWVVEKPEQYKDFLRFCRARGIGTLFLHAPADHLAERAPNFHAFLAAAHKQKMRVEALDGASDWAFEAAKPEGFIAGVLAFNGASELEGERFDGVHLDVEPYDTAQWKESADDAEMQYLTMLDAARAKAGGLPVTADVPPWFNEVDTPEGPLLNAVIARVDAIGLMAYTHQVKGLAAESRDAIAFAQRQHMRVWVGISAQLMDSDMDPARPVRPQVEAVVRAAERAFRHGHNFGGFRGVAIHDYEHLRDLYTPTSATAAAVPQPAR